MREVDDALLNEYPLPPIHGGDKEERGRVLIVGGDVTVPGAPLLAATAALRSGAGRLQIAVPRQAAIAVAVAMPEARVVAFEAVHRLLDDSDAHVFGPGMFSSDETRDFVRPLLSTSAAPCVIDAGAFCALKAEPGAVRAQQPRAVITPHAKEMAFLMDAPLDSIQADPQRYACEAADRFGVVAILKGETTHIAASRDECFAHTGGSAGLATSGSGDTLAGIIGAFLARGGTPVSAALWGVTVHARAGAALESRVGIGFLAREICDELPHVLARAQHGTGNGTSGAAIHSRTR